MVDESTHFSATSFLKSQITDDTWKSISRLLSHTNMWTPFFLAVDQGSDYISKEMRANSAQQGPQWKMHQLKRQALWALLRIITLRCELRVLR